MPSGNGGATAEQGPKRHRKILCNSGNFMETANFLNRHQQTTIIRTAQLNGISKHTHLSDLEVNGCIPVVLIKYIYISINLC
jgi:hypothetical protein